LPNGGEGTTEECAMRGSQLVHKKRVAWLEGGNGTEKGKRFWPFIVLLAVLPVFNWQAMDIWKG